MEIDFIRNATMVFRYGGHTILGDPMFGEIASWMETMNWPSPTVPMPVAVDQILDGVEAVLVTHTHADHFDELAQEVITKTLPLFGQPVDVELIESKGFTDVRPITEPVVWEGITITRTGGHHGLPPLQQEAGPVSGFVLQAPGEPTVYWCGDTIWCDEVREALAQYAPDVVITHSGGALFLVDGGPAIMDIPQTIEVAGAAPDAVVMAIHLEALPHCSVSRPALRYLAERAGISSERLLIPADGERLSFS